MFTWTKAFIFPSSSTMSLVISTNLHMWETKRNYLLLLGRSRPAHKLATRISIQLRD